MLHTLHAEIRMAQRGLSDDALRFVAAYGQITYRTGVKFIFLGRRDIPRQHRRSHGHLEGLTLVLNPRTHEVITCYRNREALSEIRRKAKRAARGERVA